MRIVICIHALSGGGAERVAASLAGGFAAAGDKVLVLTSSHPDDDFYALPPSVARESIGPFRGGGIVRGARNSLSRIMRLRCALERFGPEVAIAFMGITNVRTIWAVAGRGIPVVATEHTDPRYGKPPFPWGLARRWAYRNAARLVSVSAGVDAGFGWLDPARRAVIPNPLPDEIEGEVGAAPAGIPAAGRPTVVSMGRLERFKGHDLLIRAFSRLAAEFSDWDLLLLGEGSARPELERLVAATGLGARVHLPGAVRDPFPVLRLCAIFSLASRHEGFGNAITEAMACGLPVIVTDCPSGPGEIVRHEENGLLVPVEDVGALEASLRRLMADAPERERLAAAGRESSRAYRLNTIVGQWRALLSELVG